MKASRVLALAGSALVVGEYVRRRGRAQAGWSPPRGVNVHTASLAARTAGDDGPPIVLLHGLVASGIYWGAAYDQLADGHRLIVPDLLGFGRSPRPPDADYGPDDHVRALIACLDELGATEPAVIGAHSLGTLVAFRLAAVRPERVASIVAFGPPLYPDAAAARAHVTATSPMARLFVLPGPAAEAACKWVCEHRRLAAAVARLTNPSLPGPIAADGVEHTWASYSQTLELVLLAAGAAGWLRNAHCPVQLVAGDGDPVVDRGFLAQLAAECSHVALEVWDGGHDLPLAQAEVCVQLIRDAAITSARRAGLTGA